jgi:hypothetical protein
LKIFEAMDELLKRPEEALQRAPYRILAGTVVCLLGYAAVAGLFQSGSSVLLAMLKVPLIIAGSIILCIPSLYVFTALAGGDPSRRTFSAAVAGFSGLVGLVLIALVPVVWLFSVSSKSLPFIVWLHLLVWLIAIVLAKRVLPQPATPARGVAGLWLVLLFLVSLQMTTYLRPVLWRDPGAPLFESEKKSFFTHFYDVGRWQAARDNARAASPSP